MIADVYYPVVSQGAYGDIQKTWTLDRTVVGNFSTAGSEIKEELVINVDISKDALLIARVKQDLRYSDADGDYGVTNILVTNIRDRNDIVLYKETDGVRRGQPTLYEIATHQPFFNPFGRIEHYRIILRRSENQSEDL
jgi:hypothetical protein